MELLILSQNTHIIVTEVEIDTCETKDTLHVQHTRKFDNIYRFTANESETTTTVVCAHCTRCGELQNEFLLSLSR